MKKGIFLAAFLHLISLSADQISPDAKIYVAGRGLVGSALCKVLKHNGFRNILNPSHKELNLVDQKAVHDFFAKERPDYVFLAAAKVGGIKANMDYPAQFIYENLMIECNVIHAAHLYKTKKLLFLGSSCIYPRDCPQPIAEKYLLTSPLETSNECYALAKISGLYLCKGYNQQYGKQDFSTKFISCMPCNLYGPGDNFNLETSHVLPALMAKMEHARLNNLDEVEIWGTGKAYREFLYSEDLAKALLFLMENYEENETVNVGTGEDTTIAEIAYLIKKVVGYEGNLKFNTAITDGTPRKRLDTQKINALGWKPQVAIEDGLHHMLSWYRDVKE